MPMSGDLELSNHDPRNPRGVIAKRAWNIIGVGVISELIGISALLLTLLFYSILILIPGIIAMVLGVLLIAGGWRLHRRGMQGNH
jgi:hypothetical protein